MKEQKNKGKISEKGHRRGVAAGVITAAILEWLFRPVSLFPLHFSLIGTAIAAGISWFAYKTFAMMGTDLDTSTPSTRKQEKLEKEMESLGNSGDENVDALIQKGQEMLRQIRRENSAIPDPTLTRQMYELESMCVQIFKTVQESPGKAPQIRKFMNYYLPTTLKMLASYRTMQNRGVSPADLRSARDTLIHGMNMILTACQKQLDNLFKSDILDISTDIDVLEQMLKRDGFADGGLGNVPVETPEPVQQEAPAPQPQVNARTAASAQMGTSSTPTIEVPEEDQPGYYKRNRSYQYKGKQ